MSKAEDRYLELFQDGRLRNCSSKEAFLLGYHQAEKDVAEETIEKVIVWLKKNATYTHPRKGTKECLINIAKLKDDLRNE